ncbi:MAG TPA: hypothetical protein VFN10_16435 [Thermoanaerobaculia bacterium]|nr:hypothetical protein [Thermoanaerobaculia bacterium]
MRNALAAAAALFFTFAAHAATQQQVGFTIGPSGSLDARGTIEFRVQFANGAGTGAIRQLTDLQGLDAAALSSPQSTPVRFRIDADAGSFDCTGHAQQQRGNGTCTFTAASEFPARLAAVNVAPPTNEEQVRMAAHGVTLADAAALNALGYRGLTARRLIDLRIFHVTPGYIRELAALGYERVPLDTVVDLHIFGVTTDYVRAVQAAGDRNVSLARVIDLRRSAYKPH